MLLLRMFSRFRRAPRGFAALAVALGFALPLAAQAGGDASVAPAQAVPAAASAWRAVPRCGRAGSIASARVQASSAARTAATSLPSRTVPKSAVRSAASRCS